MKKSTVFFIIFALVLYCFAFQNLRGLYERDEGRYTCVASHMVQSGDWMTPRLHKERPHWTKPPLTYWAIAAGMKIFGHNEFAVRFPGALAYFLTILLLFGIAQLFLDCRPWVAAFIYGTAIFPFAAANIVTTDSLLTLWETAAVFAFARAAWGKDRHHPAVWMLTMWICFGLAFMTKGPAGLLPLLAILVYRAVSRPRSHCDRLLWVPGVLLFLLVVIPWFAAVIHAHPELASYFVKKEVVDRLAGAHHRNAGWYGAIVVYVPVLVAGTLPWSHWVILYGCRGVKALLRDPRGVMALWSDQTRFLLLWFLCPMAVFAVVRSRLPLYILPLFVPLSLLLARKLESRSFWRVNLRTGLASAGWLAFLLLLRVAAARVPSRQDARAVSHALRRMISPDRFDELVFYNTHPIYGLNFYLYKETEAVNRQTILEELQEKERRVWLLRPKKRVELAEIFKQNTKAELRALGTLNSDYAVFEEIAPRRAE